jgi:hypothetical protein
MAQLSVVSISPSNNSINISTNTKLVINFSEEVKPGKGSVFIYTDGNEIMQIYSDDVYVTYNSDQVIIDLPKQLEAGIEYLIHIDDDAFSSQSGKYLKTTGPAKNWSFTTKDKVNFLNSTQEPTFYPNPAKDEIRLTNMDNIKSMHISNLTGRNIMEIKSPDTRISLTNLPKGMYFISFVTYDGKKITKKLLKQ